MFAQTAFKLEQDTWICLKIRSQTKFFFSNTEIVSIIC